MFISEGGPDPNGTYHVVPNSGRVYEEDINKMSIKQLAILKKKYEKEIDKLTNSICRYASKIADINSAMDKKNTEFTLLTGLPHLKLNRKGDFNNE